MSEAQRRYLFRILAGQGYQREAAEERLKDLFEVSALTEITTPVLVAVGEEDTLTDETRAREIADAIPTSQLRTIPECGHVPCLERPDAVTQLLGDWLENVAA